ncbi:MAG: hypothetical protein H0W72_11930 [Planctomycetes bacterium]|nr:hypothetical protein [Planctomycetota bacterium]
MPPRVAIAANRLYGISMRPQELALYGDKVQFSLRYAPMFDDAAEVTAAHYKLLVLEIGALIDDQRAVGQPTGTRLELLKCGWELELSVDPPAQVGKVPELSEEVPLLLGRIADTVNELARRAGLEAPLGPVLIEQMLRDYRRQETDAGS